MRHADAEKIWSHHCIGPEAYDKTMSERYWSDRFEMEDSPSARAHRLLGAIDVGPGIPATRIPATTVSGSTPRTSCRCPCWPSLDKHQRK